MVLVLLALPWPGLGKGWSGAWSSGANAMVVPVASADDVRMLLKASDDAPWRLTVYMVRLSTEDKASLPFETRQLYLSLSTFVALAAAAYLQGWRSGRDWAIGFGSLLLLAFGDMLGVLLMAADELGWSPMPSFVRKIFNVVLMSYNGFPGMAFAIPAIVWGLTIGRAALYGALREGEGADRPRR